MKKKLTESDLIIPVLELMKRQNGIVTIRQIRDYLLENYPLTEADLLMSITRPKEHKFEQQIRNLTSHRKLEKMGLAKNIENGFMLLPEISDLLNNSSDWVFDIIGNGYKPTFIRKQIEQIDKKRKIIGFEELTTEGLQTVNTVSKKRIRSSKLREAAVNYFTHDGIIKCDCCGFEFPRFYGPSYGTSCIEIHHMKPIFMYSDMDEKKTIQDALENLLPVCPNCHRVIHKNQLFSKQAIKNLKREITIAHQIF